MSEQQIRVGVIGTGVIGKKHINKYSQIDGATVVAVSDIDESVGRAAAEEFGIADVYTDYHDLLVRDDIDAVDVCLHNMLHRPVACDAMQAGKDVYCEKPIAATYADGLAMIDCARQTGRKLHIQIGTMFGPAGRAAKETIDAGRCGDIYHGRAYVNLKRVRPYIDGKNSPAFVQKAIAGGGALIDWGIYVISQVLWQMGNPKPVRITGQTYDRVPMDPTRRAESKWDVEEMGCGFVHFENGATMDILAAWALNLDETVGCCVAGDQGGILFAPFFNKQIDPVRFFSVVGEEHVNEPLDLDAAKARWAKDGDAYDGPQNHWVRALQGKIPLMPTAEVALNMILIAEGIYRSVELGREVRAEELVRP